MNTPGKAATGPTVGPTADPVADRVVRPLRADAERNRRRILDAARAVFAERGLEAGFDEIARRAGVGVGTVYRRFPDREDLVDALFVERIDEMVELAVAAGRHPDPWQGLVFFLEKSITAQLADRGLSEVLGDEGRGHQRVEHARDQMQPVVTALVARTQEWGQLRADVEPLDLAVLSSTLSRVSTDARPDLWSRYLALALDGMRATTSERASLPVPGPAEADLAQLVNGRRPRP